MLYLLRQSPIFRLLISLCIGIITGENLDFNLVQSVSALLIALLMYIVLVPGKKIKWKFRHIKGLSIALIFFTGGINAVVVAKGLLYPKHFSKFHSEFFILRITAPPVKRIKSVKTDAEIVKVFSENKWKNAEGNVRIYFEPEGFLAVYGDYIIVKGQPLRVTPPLNPNEFDNAAYLAHRNIYHQLYVPSGKWSLLSFSSTSAMYKNSWQLRDYLIGILSKELSDPDIYSVASALLVGYEEDIGDEVMNAYAASGTLHVLSVSGMHVALIYKVLEWMLSFLLKMKRGRHFYYAFIIVFVWFYSLLSGLSPSVLRAAMMLTLVVGGKWMSRTSSVHNSMFVACFFLLICNPFLIFEVGFQLSLLAVGGIVFIHPLLFRIYTPKGKLMFALWSIVSVSLCATLLTFPIGLFYFHQFPNLFLISNMVIIPATTAAIYGCIALVFLYHVPLIGYLIAKSVYATIWFSNQAASIIERVPCSVTNGISITGWEVVFIYILVVVFVFFLLRRQAYLLALLLSGCILISAFQCYENIRITKSKEFIVFAVRKKSCIVFRNGLKSTMISDTSASTFRFQIQSYLLQSGISMSEIANEKHHDLPIYKVGGKIILVPDSAYFNQKFANDFNVNFMVLSSKTRCDLSECLKKYSPDLIILDSSINPASAKRIKAELQILQIPYHDVMDKGAFIYKESYL